jgi:hypothetical protein
MLGFAEIASLRTIHTRSLSAADGCAADHGAHRALTYCTGWSRPLGGGRFPSLAPPAASGSSLKFSLGGSPFNLLLVGLGRAAVRAGNPLTAAASYFSCLGCGHRMVTLTSLRGAQTAGLFPQWPELGFGTAPARCGRRLVLTLASRTACSHSSASATWPSWRRARRARPAR